ncbi:MAG: arginase family protein [Acidobacteriia bacterium]|nr:arginase family protein [Terriglobia bacterium]
MAVKIVRQPNKIALLGVPTSAAAMSAGHEGAPAALRAAGLIDRLRSIGCEVSDLGDDPIQVYQPDEESPRARNVPRVLTALETLKPRIEQAVKSGALPLILSGDCSVVLATIAGARRYFRHVSLIYMDRDADLNTPATTSSGCVDGMVISHVIGRGAAELVRFWGEPPLVREPDLALFGVDRLEPGEEEALRRAPLRVYRAADVQRMGGAAAAEAAIERVHGSGHEFVLHFDVDVIAGFQATNNPGTSGLRLDEVRAALAVFAKQKHLAAIDVSAYNPAKDPDGSGAKLIIDLLAGVLTERLEALKPAVPAESATVAAAASSGSEMAIPPAAPGEAWSSESLEGEAESTEAASEPPAGEQPKTSGEAEDSHS